LTLEKADDSIEEELEMNSPTVSGKMQLVEVDYN